MSNEPFDSRQTCVKRHRTVVVVIVVGVVVGVGVVGRRRQARDAARRRTAATARVSRDEWQIGGDSRRDRQIEQFCRTAERELRRLVQRLRVVLEIDADVQHYVYTGCSIKRRSKVLLFSNFFFKKMHQDSVPTT